MGTEGSLSMLGSSPMEVGGRAWASRSFCKWGLASGSGSGAFKRGHSPGPS